MKLMWFEIKFSEVDLSRGKDIDLVNEIQKLYKILDHLEGITLFHGKHKRNIGQKYYLTIPDNDIGRNLMQYIKLKNYVPRNQPEDDQLTYLCGSLSAADIVNNINESHPFIEN
ncbi:MAG TPA: hypothetical protein VMT35_17620 [Ignavibacteriaceae bacterium]|nr:hypothetical protein [Ignavibacteriaceae bacterium]